MANLSGSKPLQPILPKAESWIFLWLNTFDYLKVVAQNYGCDSLVLSLNLVIYSVINDFTSEIKNWLKRVQQVFESRPLFLIQ